MDPIVITALVTGIVTVIAALVAGIVTIVNAVKTTKTEVSEKLDNITVLVDGRYSTVLQELADVKQLLAEETGLKSDAGKAVDAQVTANKQASVVKQAESIARKK